MAVYKKKLDSKEPVQYRGDGIGNFHHVGLYIGGGKVIEAKGAKYGVVESCISEWGYASRLKNTEYDLTEQDVSGSGPTTFPARGKVVTQSGSLNLRKEPVSGAILTRIPQYEIIPITGMKDGWYKAGYNGKVGYVSPDYIQIISGGVSYTVTCTVADKSVADKIIAYIQSTGYTATMEQGISEGNDD